MLWLIPADTHQEVRHHGSAKPSSIKQPEQRERGSGTESVGVAEAVALMADLGEAVEEEPEATATADEGADDDALPESDGEEGESADEALDEEAEAPVEGSDAPKLWSAEDKAAWNAYRSNCGRC